MGRDWAFLRAVACSVGRVSYEMLVTLNVNAGNALEAIAMAASFGSSVRDLSS